MLHHICKSKKKTFHVQKTRDSFTGFVKIDNSLLCASCNYCNCKLTEKQKQLDNANMTDTHAHSVIHMALFCTISSMFAAAVIIE